MELSDVLDVLDVQAIIAFAGERAYERGARYHAEGRVELDTSGSNRTEATVRGTFPYTVELWVERDDPAWSCTCPAAEDGSFCKHCVAVALAVVGGTEPVGRATQATDGTTGDVVAHVEGMDREQLVEIVLGQCKTDRRLRDRMVAEIRAARGDRPDIDLWHRRIDTAFAPFRDFIDYREAQEWATGVFEVLDGLGDLLAVGHGDAVIELSEYAHRRADGAIEYLDDSAGWLTEIEGYLTQLHFEACEEVRPDPVVLAGRLADLELTSELDGFHRAAITYADLLGEEGIAEYRRIVESAGGTIDPDADRFDGRRFAVEQARIGVAIASGDPDELISVRGDDLRSPDDYLEIARMLVEAGRIDEAVEWSERGLGEFARRTFQPPGLRDFLAGIYRTQDREFDAVVLYWEAFLAAPSVSSYRSLLEEAGGEVGDWQVRCVEELRSDLSEASGDATVDPSHRFPSPSAGALIDILMYEGEVEDAWMVATEHGCSDATWMTLARARETDHPLASISVYERAVFTEIDKKKRNAYLAAVDLLARIRRLADAAGQPQRFDEVIVRVRTEHRPKRSLMGMLDDKGW